MDIYVKKFGSDEAPIKFSDVDEEESVVQFKQRVATETGIPLAQIRLIDDDVWGSLLLENGTVEDISTNLVHLLVLPQDRSWDQFFFFVKPLGSERILVEADFLETVTAVKSRLLKDGGEPVADDRIGLIYKWSQLADDMPFDDEQVDMAVGCTLDLFIREPDTSTLIFKSTCYKSFTLSVNLEESVAQMMQRLEAQESIAVADQIIMLLGSESNGELDPERTLSEQGIGNETVLVLDVRYSEQYKLKVQIAQDQTIELPFKFNETIEALKQTVEAQTQIQASQQDLLFKGRPLEDDFKVYQYNLCINDTLFLQLRQ